MTRQEIIMIKNHQFSSKFIKNYKSYTSSGQADQVFINSSPSLSFQRTKQVALSAVLGHAGTSRVSSQSQFMTFKQMMSLRVVFIPILRCRQVVKNRFCPGSHKSCRDCTISMTCKIPRSGTSSFPSSACTTCHFALCSALLPLSPVL